MIALPEKLRITRAEWDERTGDWKAQLGDADITIGYVFSPGGFGDTSARERLMQIATRVCEGWNA